MGAIKDLRDLIADLVNSVKDRRFLSEVAHLQSLASSLEAEHFEIQSGHLQIKESNLKFVAENARLQQQVADLQASHAKAMTEL